MLNIQKIIVPVDFSKHTDGLVTFAIDVAEKLGGKVTFLHVAQRVTDGAEYFDVNPTSLTVANEELFTQAQKMMNSLVEKFVSTCAGCVGVTLRGDVADAIVDYVRNEKADLVIIGTHGYKGIQKIVMGSVTSRVMRNASCPILVHNPYKGQRNV